MFYRLCIGVIVTAMLCLGGTVVAENWYENLNEGEIIQGFSVECMYLNSQNEAMGARMLHLKTGFTMDMFQIQSVPQSFIWVNTPPEDDMGEPHTCEHLLLGKGSKGRYVASLEDMSLGRSTAYTSQLYTAYPFSSEGGNDVFFTLLEEKLDALLNPNFSDEEIRREVCNIGIDVDPASGEMTLDEKGTVYTEMVSTFEKHWYHLYGALDEMVYGADHPLSNVSGGEPSAIRKMTPNDLREFHDKRYQLNNMGMIVTYPAEIANLDLLSRTDEILKRLDTSGIEDNIARTTVVLPRPQPAAAPGTIKLTYYPGSNENDPGNIAYYWPADLELTLKERTLLGIFMYCLGGSQTSNLYNKLINSDTRVVDLGANRVWAGVDDHVGHVVSVGISNVNPDLITESQIKSIRGLITDEIAAVAAYDDGSADLNEFNSRALSYLKQRIKQTESYLNSPPGFGLRGGGGGGWYGLMKDLEEIPGFRKSMLKKELYDDILADLQADRNIWTPLLAKCQLADKVPYGAGCKAKPALAAQAVTEKNKRLENALEALKTKYNVAIDAEAIAQYRNEYDEQTRIIEEETAKIPMPKFLNNPPMTFDENLDYQVLTIGGTVPLVASTFNSMTSTTFGLALNLRVVPQDKLMYVPLLPDLITETGVRKDGEVVTFAQLNERLKNEVLGLRSFITANPTTGRVELMVRGSGSSPEENANAVAWMKAGLFSPYLDKANMQRIKDVVDANIQGYRNRMNRSEESWVQGPANSYRHQNDPLLLAGYCFLTQEHFMHRVKWRLMSSGNPDQTVAVQTMFDNLAAAGEGLTKERLVRFADDFTTSDPTSYSSGPFRQFASQYIDASVETQDILIEALGDLAAIIATVPEENADKDWAYLCSQMKNDLLFKPENVLSDLAETMALLRHKENARMYIVSSEASREVLIPRFETFVSGLDAAPVVPATYADVPVVLSRVEDRTGNSEKPTYVGLVNENTRNGVFIYTADCANLTTTDPGMLLDYVAARLYGGGGAHSMFMKTWSAGLAYSNGLRSSETSGRIIYYAERCPDLATTMRFVVNELENAPRDPKLAEYAIAQAFVGNRSSNSYETRGAAMADNLADGITPEVVAGFRRRILDLRTAENLYDQLHDRMQFIYGKVLIGYGGELKNNKDGNYFIIGPPAQFESLSDYIESAEGKQDIARLYPRDFWITD